MSFINITEFKQAQLSKIVAGQFNEVLGSVSQMAHDVAYHPRALSKVLSSFELDDVCRELGQAILSNVSRDAVKSNDERPWVFIATYLYNSGGHTRALEDYIHFLTGKKCVVLLTNLGNGDPIVHKGDLYVDEIERLGASCEISLQGSLVEKLCWLQQKLVALNPERTFLFNHFYDSVAIAAAEAIPEGAGYFFHHADYRFSLGVHTACLKHIDFHAAGWCVCRDKVKVERQIYIPLSAPDIGVRSEQSFYQNGCLTTASSGAPAKYSEPYPYSYLELIAPMIKATKGQHVHIGALPEAALLQIYQSMDAHGLARDRLVYLPVVPSVWRALLEYGVDVYLPSFPVGGNKATIEAMGSGTPILSHQGFGDYRYLLGGDFVVYPDAPRWTQPDGLLGQLVLMNHLEFLQQHRAFSREHYELYCSEQMTKNDLSGLASHVYHKPNFEMETFSPMSLQDFYFYESYPAYVL